MRSSLKETSGPLFDKEAGLLLDWKGSSLSVFLSVYLSAGVVSARCFEGSRGHQYRPVSTQDGHSEFAPHHMEAKVSAMKEENVFACALSASCMTGRDLSDRLTLPFILLAFW